MLYWEFYRVRVLDCVKIVFGHISFNVNDGNFLYKWAKLKKMMFTTIKDASDHISMCRAVMTLIFNLLLPGIGTIMTVKTITATQIRDSQAKLSSDSIYRVKIPYNEHCEIIKKRAL